MSTSRLSLSRPLALLTLGAACVLPGAAEAARVKVAAVTASSSYPADESVNYEPKQLIDGKSGTSWVEGDPGGGLGSWVELDLGGAQNVQKIQVWGGMWYSSEYWARANRPKSLEVKFSDGSVQEFAMTDAQEVQVLSLAKPVSTSTIRLKVKANYNGSTWQDTAISEIQVFDAGADDQVRPVALSASTTTAATLTFSDGSTATVEVKATVMPQTIAFPSKSTSNVTITFTGISKGKEFNDLCISEAYFQ